MAFVSSSSGIVIVDSRSKSGSITLPAASTLVGRSLIFKDGFDSFGTSSLTLLTTGVDRFDNLSSILNVGETNGFINLVASSNKWHTVGGTRLVSQNVDNNNVSTINGIVVNNNLYVIGSSNGILSYSVDDVNWINSTSQPFVGYNITGIVYNGSYWLASSSGPVNLAISFDGINWTAINQINLGSINSIIWNGSLWIITTSNGIWSSTNNINWTLKYYSPFPIFGIDYNGTRYVSIGVNTFNNTPIVNYSADLINWTDSPTIILDNIDIYVYSVKWNGSLWIIGGVNYGSKTLLYSVDGINWSVTNNTGLDTIYSIDWNGSIWVAGGIKNTSYGGIAYSVDGLTWSESSSADSILSNFNGSIYNFTWDGKFWRAIGFYNNNGVILTSPDGINWKLKNNSLTSSTLKSIENSRFAPSVYGVISTTTITLRSSITLLNTQLISSVNGSDNNLVSSITGLGTTGYLSSIPQNIITENIITSSITLSSITFISYSSFYTQYGYGNMEYESTFVNTTSINNQIYLCNANKVAYGNGLWLVAGSSSNTNNNSASNVIFRSSDTSNWALSFSTTFNTYINGIAYGSNRWVAVGQNNGSPPNSIYTSVDAITWTSSFNDPLINSGVSRYRAVAYGNNKWVAVGQNWSAASNNQTIVYSSDGIVWYQSANNPFPGGIGYSVGYGNNLWIATANGVSSIIATSSNGINWNAAQSSPFDNGYILDIKYANGKWVAVGFSVVGNIMYSTDGSNWTPSSIFTFTGRSVAHDGSKWIAGGEGSAGPVMFTGTDGINWSPVTNNFQDGNVQGIAYANSTWLSVGLSNSIEYFSTIQRSANGLDWTLGTASQTLSTLKYTSTFSYVSSFSTYTSPITILKSTIAEALTLTSTVITINGVPYSPPNFKTSVLDLNYTVSTTIVPFYTYSNSVVTTIAYGNNQWLAGSIGPQGTDNRPSIWNNSNEWTTNVDNPNTPLNQLSYNNNQWLGLGDNFILAGYDSYNLQTISFSIPIEFKTVAYNGKFWLAGGHTECNIGSIQISADGFNWYAQSNPLLRINGIAYGKNSYDSNLWVALGEPGTYIYTSFDGSNWTSQANSFQQGNTIRYGSNLWLAGGVNQTTPVNSIETSTDGSNWTERSNYLSIVNAFAYNDGKWVATGKHVSSLINGIETSVDGINWTTVSSMITVGKTVAYANGMWIAGGHKLNSTAIIEYSLDGTTWNSNINYFHTYSTILTTQSNKLLVNNEPIIGDNIKLSSLITNNVGLLYNYIGNNYRENVYTGGSNYSNVNAILYAKNLLIVGIAGEETGSATIDSKDSIQILNNNNWIQQSNNFSIVNGIDYNDGIWIAVGNNTGGATPSGIQISFNGSNWMQVGNSGYKTSPVFCVKYGNGLWLVGYSGNSGAPPSIRATYDGYNWYMQSNQMDAVRKIDYGNSLWVAVGDSVELGSTIQTSVDGSNWTLQSNSLQAAYSIKYANSLWVAGGINTALCNDTTIQISPDAITWEPRSNYLNQVNDIAYNDGIWLSVGCNTTNSNQCIQTSPDGSNWTVQTASYLKYGQSIGYSNGVWMVGGNTEVIGAYGNPKTVGLIEYSYDTVNWTSSFITSTIKSASTVLTGLSNSLFLNGVALSTTGNLQLPNLTSSIRGLGTVGYLSSGVQALDLASTVQGIQSLGYVSSAVQPPDLTSTIEGLGTFGYLSTGIQKVDLTSSIQGLGTTGFLSSPTRYITDSFCVAGGQNSNGEYCLQASYDGFTWINASNQPFGTSNSGQVNGVSFNGSYWVASGNGNCSIAVSYDGFNWIASSNDPFGSNGVARASAWNGSYWVVVGNSTDSSVTAGKSYDGLNWTSSINNHLSNGGGTGIAWNGYIWVGTGSNYLTSNGTVSTTTTASIVISSDGMNWVKASNDVFVADIPYSAEATGIAWNGSYWVAVGRAQALGSALTVGISSDGYNWVSSLNNPFSAPGGGGATVPHGNKIAWNGSKWLAVGITASNEYSMAESTNGYNWTYPSSNPFIDGACTDVTWNGSYWITCSDNSKIATSPNAINWTVQPTSITGAARYGIASRIVLPYIGKNIVPAATTSLYIPLNPAIWDSPPPSTIQKAIDRLASFLSAFTTSNIPI